jgi:hypothetical protein
MAVASKERKSPSISSRKDGSRSKLELLSPKYKSDLLAVAKATNVQFPWETSTM